MVKRRKVILGIGTSVALAGCSEGGTTTEGSTDSPTEQSTVTEEPTNEPTDSPTPTEEDTPTPEPPSFEVVSYEIPETVEIGEEVTFAIIVRNTGEQEGSLSVPLYGRTPDSSWQEGGDVTFEDVGPGETATVEVGSIVYDYINRYEYRLGNSSKTAIVQTVSAKIAWGEEYTTPAGYRIRVDEPNLQDTYEYQDYQGNIKDKEPDSGGQWAFVNIWTKNETGQADYSPLASEFGLLYGSSQADGETILLDEPVNKGEPFEGGELQPGVERSGWVAFQISGNVGLSDLTMAWSQETYEGQIGVNWGAN